MTASRTLSGIKRFREETNASQAQLEARIKDLEAIIRQTHPATIPLSTSPSNVIAPSSLTSSSGFLSPQAEHELLADNDTAGDEAADAAGTLEL